MKHKAAVRIVPLKSAGQFTKASAHGRGEDRNARSRRRADAKERALAIYMSEDGKLKERLIKNCEKSPATDYLKALNAMKKAYGIGAKKGGALALHCMCVVSPELMGKDLHDPNGKRVGSLLALAIKWGNQTFGTDGVPAVFGARYDVDEVGGGVVDLFVAPHHVYAIGSGKPKRRVACSAALDRLAKEYERHYSYSAVQDSWAKFAKANGWPVERGDYKSITHREHLSPEEYKAEYGNNLRLATRALADAAKIQKLERGDEWLAEADQLRMDAEGVLDRDADAICRLKARYAKGGHTPDKALSQSQGRE